MFGGKFGTCLDPRVSNILPSPSNNTNRVRGYGPFYLHLLQSRDIGTLKVIRFLTMDFHNDFGRLKNICLSELLLGVNLKRGGERILVIFQDRPMFCHTIQKVSACAIH